MKLIELINKVERFYNNLPKQRGEQDFYIVTDGTTCRKVNNGYKPLEGETVFRCYTKHGELFIYKFRGDPKNV